MLRRVTLPPFGNTIIDATIPFSVTIIMSQFEYPVNMSGGLISKGEPVGASHLGQLVEIVWQLRGEAGARQVENAKVGLAQVLGAGGNCAVTMLKR